MATNHRQNSHANKKKIIVSYEIREKDERYHRSGVNSLQYDNHFDRLYSAGRDSVIRIWNFSNNDQSQYSSQKNYHQHNQRQHSPQSISNHSRDDSESNYSHRPTNNPNKLVDDEHYVQSMEHHTDWVNDIILSSDGRHLLSVSNDTTIKVWNARQGYCLSTLRSHKDYAKCLAYSNEKEVLASAGFDRLIYLWDVQVLTMLTTSKNTVTTKPLEGSKDSIYSLDINHNASLIASGSTEKVIRLWDPRSRQKMLKFRGHTDNVRCLLFSNDGSLLLSGSSDGTIRVWSIPQQRCISIIRVHDKGVWTLQADECFNTVYSGGKDGKIFMTDLKQTNNTSLVCQESDPILRILLVNRNFSQNNMIHRSYHGRESPLSCSRSSLWVTTSNSSIKNWPIQDFDHLKDYGNNFDRDNTTNHEIPIIKKPDVTIKGNPAVINYHVLNDKRHILTRESDNSIALYDVLTAHKLETIQRCENELDTKDNFDFEIKRRFKMIYVPNWFTVDLKTGILCIHIEENEAFSAWVSAKDYGFLSQIDAQDPKINLGRLMLQALFEYWPSTYECPDQAENRFINRETSHDNHQSFDYPLSKVVYSRNESPTIYRDPDSLDKLPSNGVSQRVGNQYFSVPPHTPIIISEGNQTIFKFIAQQASEQCEDMFLVGIIPPWISDIVISKCQPKLTKVSNDKCYIC